jgi:hypothetical protein
MPRQPAEIAPALASVRRRLDARAAGAWRVEGDRLARLAFDAAPDMPPDVAGRFASMTVSVPLDRRELGIVAAVVEGRRAVSVAAELPADGGSGDWLRKFAADRSVAVPIRDAAGAVVGVVSVALVGPGLTDDEVESRLREAASDWFSSPSGPPSGPSSVGAIA